MATLVEHKLLTAEEYGRLPEGGRLTELVRGEIVEMNRPHTSHGYYMSLFTTLLWQFVEQRALGRVVCGDAGVVTERDPDTVRGPDVAYYSYQRIPAGPLPAGYWPASPELVVEIRSTDDRWKDIMEKVAEYLRANVATVAVVDPEAQTVHVYSADQAPQVLNQVDKLTFPAVLPGFEVSVKRLFE